MEERSQEASAREKLSLEKDVLIKEKQDMLLTLQQQEDKELELLQQVEKSFIKICEWFICDATEPTHSIWCVICTLFILWASFNSEMHCISGEVKIFTLKVLWKSDSYK